MDRIELLKIPVNKDSWTKALFVKGIYKLIPSGSNAIKLRVGTETEASVVVDENTVLVIEDLEEYKEFKATISEAYFYYYDLNEVKDFIEKVENYRDEFLTFKQQTEASITSLLERVGSLEQRVKTLEGSR